MYSGVRCSVNTDGTTVCVAQYDESIDQISKCKTNSKKSVYKMRQHQQRNDKTTMSNFISNRRNEEHTNENYTELEQVFTHRGEK